VYALTSLGLRNQFWKELMNIRSISDAPWFIGGDFNMVRTRQERKGNTFNHSISRKFNSFISSHMLIDLRPKDRLYTWSNLRDNPSFTCLDRFFCSVTWEREFPGCISKSLPRFQSDHNALILKTNVAIHVNSNSIIKYDKEWSKQEGFNELLYKWWHSYKVKNIDLGNSWKFKLQHLRRHFRGWNYNIKGKKTKRQKGMLRQYK
jgi:hypothetical protein